MSTDEKRIALEFSEAEPELGGEFKEITITVPIRTQFDLGLDDLPLGARATVTRRRRRQPQQIVVRKAKRAQPNGIEKKLWKVSEVAACLNISARAVRKLVSEKGLPAVKRGDVGSTAAWLIPAKAVDEYIKRETGGFRDAED